MIYIVLSFITIFFSSCSSLNINFPKEEVVSKKVLERKTVVTLLSDEQNNKTNITYSEDSDLLIYGDRTNPNKITFTDKETFQSWEKDNNGIMYLKELSSDDFDISFKIENGKKVLDSIEIKADNVSLEKIAKG